MVSIIAARAENNVIGDNGEIPWRIPWDMKHFKNITDGGVVIMGRGTFESIGKLLKGRVNVVVSKTLEPPDGIICYDSLMGAIQGCIRKYPGKEIYLIGGEGIYREGIAYAGKLYMTEISKPYEGDAYFPDFDAGGYEKSIMEAGAVIDVKNHERVRYKFVEYTKKSEV